MAFHAGPFDSRSSLHTSSSAYPRLGSFAWPGGPRRESQPLHHCAPREKFWRPPLLTSPPLHVAPRFWRDLITMATTVLQGLRCRWKKKMMMIIIIKINISIKIHITHHQSSSVLGYTKLSLPILHPRVLELASPRGHMMSAKGLALGSSVGTFAHCVAVSARYSDGRSWNRQRAALLCTIGNAILGKGELLPKDCENYSAIVGLFWFARSFICQPVRPG